MGMIVPRGAGGLGSHPADELDGDGAPAPSRPIAGEGGSIPPEGDIPEGAGPARGSPGAPAAQRPTEDEPHIDIDPDSLLEGLNDPQRRAVEHRGGPLLVVAGAGSGKTRVLTRRIAHLLATGDARPWQILAITFTNKAAGEMRERLVELVGPAAERMWVSTFHSACVRILRSDAERLGYRRSFTIYDDADTRRLVEQIEKDLNIDTKRLQPRQVQGAISSAKAQLVDFESYKAAAGNVFDRRIADVYAEYQHRLLAASAMDFDDLLMVTVHVLQAFPEVLQRYQRRFRHILVDEYQDTNRAQNELVLLLGGEHHQVCVVGDADQSIYGWRGADISNIMQFEEAFPEATVVALEQNYRSTSTILETANAVIANNTTRVPKRLWTDGDRGEAVRRYRAQDEHDEAAWVAADIARLHRGGLRYGDVAIFFRTNAQSRALEEGLVRAAIPYKVIGGTRFYDRREVKDLLAYLRVLANPADEVSARRIVNVPRRGVGDTSVEKLAAWARSEGRSFADAFGHLVDAQVTGKAAAGITALAQLLDELRSLQAAGAGPGVLVEAVAERTGYRAALARDDSQDAQVRLENVSELIGAAGEYPGVDEFLESVALVSDADEIDDDGSRVSLMTLHTAKGLEFPAVYLVGLEDGVFPHLRSLDDPRQLEEERRLCYVGITRARHHLAVTHAWSRSLWGSTSHAIPSRFLGELPEEHVTDVAASWHGRPDPTRRFPATRAWGAPGGRGDRGSRWGRGGSSEAPWEDDDTALGFEPDPWGDGDLGVTGRTPVRGRSGQTESSPVRTGESGKPRRPAGPRKPGRLPKMAEQRFNDRP